MQFEVIFSLQALPDQIVMLNLLLQIGKHFRAFTLMIQDYFTFI